MSFSPAINYQEKESNHGSYRMSRVLPLGNSNVTLQASSTSEIQFEIPNKVYNLSKSQLNFEAAFLESGTASAINHIHTLGQTMIDRISLMDRGGKYLCDVTDCNQYTRAVSQYVTPLANMLENDSSRGAATQAASRLADKGHNNFRSNVAVPTATPGLANGPNGTRISAAGEAQAPSVGSTEHCYFTQGVARDGSAAGQVNVAYSIPLSEIHHTLLSLDKDLYFGQALILRIQFAPTSRLGWVSTSATDLNTGVAVLDGAVSLSNMRVNLAVEINPELVSNIQGKVRGSGLEITMPFVYSFLYSSPSGTSSNVQYRFNSGRGQRLLNIYHAVCNTGATSNVLYDQDNQADAKVVDYQTSFDNVPMTDSRIVCATGDDYDLMKPLLEGGCVQNLNVYRHNKVHCDSWRGGSIAGWKKSDGVIDGASLDNERVWQFECTTASAAYRHYTFAVIQRTLRISNDGSISVR